MLVTTSRSEKELDRGLTANNFCSCVSVAGRDFIGKRNRAAFDPRLVLVTGETVSLEHLG